MSSRRSPLASLLALLGQCAVVVLFLLMLLIAATVVLREVGHPILGSIEFVKYGMLSLVVLALAYTELHRGHIAVGIVVERLPLRAQLAVDVVTGVLTALVCLFIAYVFLWVTPQGSGTGMVFSGLVSIPALPFQVLVGIGFFAWALAGILNAWRAAQALRNPSAAEVRPIEVPLSGE